MAREGLRYELTGAFKEALRQKESVALHGLKVGTNGGEQHVNVTVRRIEEAGPLHGLVMIVFTDVSAPVTAAAAARHRRNTPAVPGRRSWRRNSCASVASRAPPMRRCNHRGRNSRSANEELQSTNEELQSTNEELTTSKEEMQSMNEELQTVNSELQVKVDLLVAGQQ